MKANSDLEPTASSTELQHDRKANTSGRSRQEALMETNATSFTAATNHFVSPNKQHPALRRRFVELAAGVISNLQQMTERDVAEKFSGCGWGDTTERLLTAAIVGAK